MQRKLACTAAQSEPHFLPHSVENHLSRRDPQIGQRYLIYNASKPVARAPKHAYIQKISNAKDHPKLDTLQLLCHLETFLRKIRMTKSTGQKSSIRPNTLPCIDACLVSSRINIQEFGDYKWQTDQIKSYV